MVGVEADDATIRAYEQRMDRYLAAYREPAGDVLAWQDRFVGRVGSRRLPPASP